MTNSSANQPFLNRYSSQVTQPRKQGVSQSMLYATGLTEADMNKPQVGIASLWYDGNPCNMHLDKLAAADAIMKEPNVPRPLAALSPLSAI